MGNQATTMDNRNMTEIFIYLFIAQGDLKMPLTPGRDKKNLLPNTLGLNENHSSQGVWGRRKKNKREKNRDEGEHVFKVPSLRSWHGSGGMCPPHCVWQRLL